MKTQISRDSFRAKQRYSGVYQQQGRMLTDADWNELTELVKRRLDEVIHDAIGSGAPRDRGMHVLNNFQLQPGYLYVDGVAAQMPGTAAFNYQDQPDFSEAQTLPLSGAGAPTGYVLYADVWERTVIALEDGKLLDAGLHGADTCTRTRTMLQVKWCETGIDPTDAAINPALGDAPLTLELWRASSEADPCDPCAAEVALDNRVGNYLFRIEVHQVQRNNDGSAQLTLKWSSENGAEQHLFTQLPPGFKQGDWVFEFFNLACEENLGVHLAKGFTPSRGQLNTTFPSVAPAGMPWVRRWDGSCVLNRSSGGVWSLASGSDKGVSLSTGLDSEAHGYVAMGANVEMNLASMAVSLGLGTHQFVAGDYWLAAVREASDAPGTLLLSNATPQGVDHHYLVLAELDASGVLKAYDNDAERRQMEFPPLSDLWAKDVGYDPAECNESTAENVQQALDWLCKQRDLRFHNKHLHGWGIVCGLAVECGPDTCQSEDEEECQRHQVYIRKGYAIDCEGNDIVLEVTDTQDIMALVEAYDTANPNAPILDANGDGRLSLSIARGANGVPTYQVEKYDPKQDTLKALLDGTLLMDFYNDCIKSLVDAIQDELTADPEEKDALVGPTLRRWITLLNLFIQLFNYENGRFVFLSPKEHEILKKFYERLQQLLQSKTFCAMFEGDEFPEYPFPETKLSTLFGKGWHSRLRLTPDGKQAYTCRAADNTINVYDLAKEEMIAVIEMPAGEGAQVVDVAFSPDGAALYAIAHLASGDTVLGVADIETSGKHSWHPVRVLCGLQLTMLVGSKEKSRLYAIGKGAGLFLFDPATMLTNTARPDPWYHFNAAGHLSLDEDSGRAWASANPLNAPVVVTYTQVVRLDLQATGTNLNPQETINLTRPDSSIGVVGTDDLLMVSAKDSGHERLCVVTRPWDANDEEKHLLVYDRTANSNLPDHYALPKTFVSLGWHSPTHRLLVGLEDHYCLQTINFDKEEVITVRHPVQISPVSLASDSAGNVVYALNYVSNTISVIPGAELETDEQFLEQLADYRNDALAAYWGLVGGLLQYLKDCFCHHLLVKCHECDADDKVYLAGIQFDDHKIYKICNFSKRKYVKSFPTVDYWLSLIPIMPLFNKAVEKFCCLVLPDLFQQFYVKNIYKTGSFTHGTSNVANKVESAQLRQGIQLWQGTSFKTLWNAEKKGFNVYGLLARDSMLNRVESASFMQPGVDRALVLNTPVNEAQQRLESQGVQVESVKTYDRTRDANLKAYAGAPLRVNPGSKVTLYERDGKVMYYALAEDTGAVTGVSPEVRAEITDLERRKSALLDVSGINAELARTEARRAEVMNFAASREELGGLEAQKIQVQQDVSALKSELAGLQAQRAALGDVAAVSSELNAARAQLEGLRQAREAEIAALNELEARRTQSANLLNAMRVDMEALRAQQQEISLTIARERPVRDVAGVDPVLEKQLNELGVRTVNDLARVDINHLTANKIDATTANVMINAAQGRLKQVGG